MGRWKEGVRCGEGEEFNPQGQSIFKGLFENDERGTALEANMNAAVSNQSAASPVKPSAKSSDLSKSKIEESTSTSTSATSSNQSSRKGSDNANSSKKGNEKRKSWFRSINVFQ